jgi:hypothetical protein
MAERTKVKTNKQKVGGNPSKKEVSNIFISGMKFWVTVLDAAMFCPPQL